MSNGRQRDNAHGRHALSFETLIAISRELSLPLASLLSGIGITDARSGSRIELEAQALSQIRGLSDEMLAMAITQIAALRDSGTQNETDPK